MPGKLYFTVGLPRSGKSTFCDNWVAFRDEASLPKVYNAVHCGESFLEYQSPRVVVAGDDFRMALYGRPYCYDCEGPVFAMMDVAIRALLLRGFDVIVDETCTTEATLLRYLRIDPDATPVFIDTPLDVCLERAKVVPDPDFPEAIRMMSLQMNGMRSDWDRTVARLKAYLSDRYPFKYKGAA